MSRIAATFERLAQQKRKALIPYITAGFPYADITPELMHAMVEAGSDVIWACPFPTPWPTAR
jgi:tryptophan synthase alpha chain